VDLLCDKLSNSLYDSLSVAQLVVDFCRGLAVGFRSAVDLSYTANRNKWSIGSAALFGFVADLLYSLLHAAHSTTNPQLIEAVAAFPCPVRPLPACTADRLLCRSFARDSVVVVVVVVGAT